MKTLLLIILGSMMAVSASLVASTVYKCQSNNGQTEFRDYPCDDGESSPMDLVYDQSPPTKSAKKKSSSDSKSKTNAVEKDRQIATKKIPQKKPDERELKANERRFISEGMTKAEVRAKIGAPYAQAAGERTERFTINKKNQIKASKSDCENCWDYPPAPADPQTRTRVCFVSNKVSSVHRLVER